MTLGVGSGNGRCFIIELVNLGQKGGDLLGFNRRTSFLEANDGAAVQGFGNGAGAFGQLSLIFTLMLSSMRCISASKAAS